MKVEDVGKKFHFAVSNLAKPSVNQGILECIKHTDRSTKNLVSYGPLESRISIAASDDVYENTRNRMAQVDQERIRHHHNSKKQTSGSDMDKYTYAQARRG